MVDTVSPSTIILKSLVYHAGTVSLAGTKRGDWLRNQRYFFFSRSQGGNAKSKCSWNYFLYEWTYNCSIEVLTQKTAKQSIFLLEIKFFKLWSASEWVSPVGRVRREKKQQGGGGGGREKRILRVSLLVSLLFFSHASCSSVWPSTRSWTPCKNTGCFAQETMMNAIEKVKHY